MFGEDPFEDIVREIFGERRNPHRNIISGEEEERNIDYVEDEGRIYFIFELPGFNEKDLIVKSNELQVNVSKQGEEEIRSYLTEKLHKGITIKKPIPRIANLKKFNHTMKNGVLEVIFEKK
jgi:HSP20 family molecular chaperone IbpA